MWKCGTDPFTDPFTKSQLEEALQFLNGSDFIPATSDPAQIEFDGPLRFKFSTPRPCDIEKNNVVYGERSAVIYTLLGSCRRHGINPFEYLKDLFNGRLKTSTRLPLAKIKEFMPAAWAKAKAGEKIAQAA